MKRNVISLFLMLMMVVSCCVPASAYSDAANPQPTILKAKDIQIQLDEHNTAPEIVAENGNESDEAVPYAVRNGVSLRQVTIRPAFQSKETGKIYYAGTRSAYWSNAAGVQSDSMKLTAPSVDALVQSGLDILNKDSELSQYTWTHIGWNVKVIIDLAAQTPRRVEYAPYYPQSPEVFDETTKTVTSQYSTLTMTGTFDLPPQPDAFYYIGFSGAFYFMNAGKESSLLMGGGVRLNSKA